MKTLFRDLFLLFSILIVGSLQAQTNTNLGNVNVSGYLSVGGTFTLKNITGSAQCAAISSTGVFSGSGAPCGAPVGTAFYALPQCGTLPNCTQIHDDGQLILDAVYNNGSPNVASGSSDPCFVSGDVGKIVFATNLAQQGYDSFINSGLTITQTTIKTVNSCHSIVLNGNASSNSTVNTPFYWGSDDTTGLNTAGAAAELACSSLYVPGVNAQGTGPGMMLFSSQLFGVGANYNCMASVGGWRTGFAVFGSAPNATFFVVAPNFSSSSCTNGGIGLNWCFGPTYYGDTEAGGFQLQNFSITGFGDSDPTNSFTSLAAFMVVGSNSTVQNVFMTGFGSSQSGFIGFKTQGNAVVSVDNAQVDGFGYQAGEFDGNTIMRGGSFFGDVPGINLGINGYTLSNGNQMGCNSGGPVVEVFSSGNFYSNTDAAQTNGCSGAGSIGVYVHGGHAYFNTSNLTVTTAGSIGLKIDNNGVVQAGQTTISGTGSGSQAFNVASGSSFYDTCGNLITSASANTISGNIFGSCSITGTALTTGGVALTGWDTSTVTGVRADSDSQRGTFTITLGGSPGTTNTVVITFPTPFLAVPPGGCRMTFNSTSTGGLPTSIVPGAVSATSASFTVNGTFSTGTEIFQYACQ